MRFIGDFHIHSHYSRATSRDLTPENLDLWGRRKGITVVGTGDFTHPGWSAELKGCLKEAEEGLFVLKDGYSVDDGLPACGDGPGVRFLLTAEISSIYKYGDRVRKVHNLIFAPGFDAIERIQNKIEALGGNIRSDGRPILGLDSRDLLELCLEADENILFVPAHIWTPWFSALGSKSGFDTIAECFRDLSGHITAVETGLSSDPPMNWMCSFLDSYTLISNSDAHSPEKLGREACLFDTGLSYREIVAAVSGGAADGYRGTVEFFPQEGKYHHDGHRKCGISWDPLTTLRHRGVCPVCGKPVTIGVLNRVAQLADRSDIYERPARDPFHSLIPLKELLAELEGTGPGSKRVMEAYTRCLGRLGPEMKILLYTDIDTIRREIGAETAAAVELMRARRVFAEPGYDGEYGHIRLKEKQTARLSDLPGSGLFEDTGVAAGMRQAMDLLDFNLAEFQALKETGVIAEAPADDSIISSEVEVNEEQQRAVTHRGSPSLIIAGPGTGKTRTVVEKIRFLIGSGVRSSSITAVTFANKAAGELSERLGVSAGQDGGVRVSTFHALGLSVLKLYLSLLGRREGFLIIDDQEKMSLVTRFMGVAPADRRSLIEYASRVKNGLEPVPEDGMAEYAPFRDYQGTLKEHNCFDLDDLVYLPVRLFEASPAHLDDFRRDFAYIIVDEYQDINPVQYRFLRMIAEHAELCAVGDPNQSIYSFRGGSPEFIERFTADYPDAVTFSLSRSYRCPNIILKASSQVLGGGGGFLSGLRDGVDITVFKTPSAASEAEQIARDIEQRVGGTGFFSFDSEVADSASRGDTALSDIAIVCRTALQMPPLEKALTDHRIPFRTVHTDSLFQRDPYRAFLNLIRVSVRGGTAAGQFPWDSEPPEMERLLSAESPGDLREALSLFAEISDPPPASAQVADMEKELIRYWRDGESAGAFLERAMLGSGLDRYDPRLQAVTIMTIHAAKGLEFDLVYIPGCEDSIIPCTLTRESAGDADEERRLFYVAMTRARREVVLSRAETRLVFGKTRNQPESPFLADIERELLLRRNSEYRKEREKPDDQLLLFD